MYTVSDFIVTIRDNKAGETFDMKFERVHDWYDAQIKAGQALVMQRGAKIGEYDFVKVTDARTNVVAWAAIPDRARVY